MLIVYITLSSMKRSHFLKFCAGLMFFLCAQFCLLFYFDCLQHPNIGGVEVLTCHDAGGFAIRRLNLEGSLRDVICHCKPRLTFLKKYSNPKLRCALPLPQVVYISTQILHGLKFLHEKGIPYGEFVVCFFCWKET